MQKETNYTNREDRLKILLGLSLMSDSDKTTASEFTDNCPDEETIACYFDNKLSSSQNKEFIELLSHCPKSYSLWLSMIETLGYTNTKADNRALKKATGFAVLKSLTNWFSTNQTIFTGAIATTFLFTMVINFSLIPFTKLPLEEQIVKIWENEEVLDLAYIDVSQFTPKAQTKSGFNIMPFPEKVAFSSGFKQGLINMSSVSENINSDSKTLDFLNSLPNEPLHCKGEICKKENQLNQQLGVWSSFALQECQQDQNSHIQYWKKQNTVIKHFIQKYKTLPDSNTLINRVSHIAESLQIVATNGLADKDKQQMIACNNIKQLALYSIQGL